MRLKATEESLLKAGHTALLFMCRAFWSRSTINYMAVNLTRTSACLVCVTLRIIPKLIELWLAFTTLQCCKDAKVSGFADFPNKFSKGSLVTA